MMIGSPKEIADAEKRVAMTPDSALQLQKLGFDCVIESGAGADAGFTDAAYEKANVTVVKTAAALWKAADVVAKVRGLDAKEQKYLRASQTVISFFWPAQNLDLMDVGFMDPKDAMQLMFDINKNQLDFNKQYVVFDKGGIKPEFRDHKIFKKWSG